MKILVLTVTILNSVAYFPRDSTANQSLEPFSPSAGRSKPFFAPNPAAYIRSAKNEFPTSADDSATVISNANNLLGTYTTPHEEEAEPESVSFTGTTTFMKEGNTEKNDASAILENYTTLFDVPDMENKNIIDATYLERYGKTISNIPDPSPNDNFIVIDDIDMNNLDRTIVNTQTSSIFSAKNGNDFESILILSTNNKSDTKSIKTATDIDAATSKINLINPVLNYRMYKEGNNLISNSDTKTMLDVAKNMQAGDLIIFKTNDISSTKHYANLNPTDPLTNTNIKFKITWPSKDGTAIEGKHTVQIQNITTPNKNNITKATGFKVEDSITKHHSNIPGSAYLKIDKNNFKSVNSDELEFVNPMAKELAKMDQYDKAEKEVILIHPDTSTTKIRRKVYSLNPDADYAKAAGNKIILSDMSGMFNPLFMYKVKPFAMDSRNLIDNRDEHRTPTTTTANEAKGKTDAKRATVKQNVAAEGAEFLPPSRSILPTGRVNHRILPNLYYNVITDDPLTITKENQNFAQRVRNHKSSPSTVGYAHFINYSDGYQPPAVVTSSSDKRLANEDKITVAEITNTPTGITANDISYVDQNTEVIIDLASTPATSPIKKSLLRMNKVTVFNNKLGDDFTISRDLDASRNDGTLFRADSSTFVKSVAPPPPKTNPVKKTSLADIIIPKVFYSKSTPAALTVPVTTAPQEYIATMWYIPRYESENSFKEDITLNYETDLPKDIDVMAEEEDILKEENMKDHIYVIPIAGDNVPKGHNLADKHYSQNSDVYNSIRFKGTIKTTADQFEFEDPASSYVAKISKSLSWKFPPEFQEKVLVKNNNGGTEYDAFSSDIFYPIMKENAPKEYTFSPKRRHTFQIPVKDNINSALENTVLLDKGTFINNYASYFDEQTDLGTEKDKVATGSITNSYASIIPVTFSTPVSFEDINVDEENYYHVSQASTPLSLRHKNMLRDDFFIHRPVTPLAKEDNLDSMDLTITESDQSDSAYISNKHTLELQREEKNSIKKPVQLAHGPNRFISHIPSSKGETSKSLLYRISHPEFKIKEKYQPISLTEENFDSDIFATSFEDYTKNSNTQHLKVMVPSLTDIDETFPSKLQEEISAKESMLSEDNTINILPEVSDLRNKKIKYFFLPHTETITMGEGRTFNTDHTVISIPMKSQGYLYRKGISSKAHKSDAMGSAHPITLEESKANEDKMDFSEVMTSDDSISPLTQDNFSQVENIPYASEVTKDTIKTASIASLNPVHANKMPTNATTLSHSISALDSMETNESGEFIMPAVDGILSIKLKSLLIPNQKRPRTTVVFNEVDDSLSNKPVVLEVSEPLSEDSVVFYQNREATEVQSDPQFFSMVSSVPAEDPTTIFKRPINVVTDIPTTEHVGIKNKSGTTGFALNLSLQPIIYKKEQINNTSDHAVSQHVYKEGINPSAKEVTTSETEANAFFKKDTGAVEDEFYISEAKIPVNVRDINSLETNPLILKPYVAFSKQKAPGSLKEIFYPDSTVSTTKARARSSFSLDNGNLERPITNTYYNLYHLPLKSTLPPADFVAYFSKMNNSEFNPALNMRESNKKLTDESITSNIIVLPDEEIISPNNIIFVDNTRNAKNEKIYVDSREKSNIAQYEDFSAESDVGFLGGENNPNNINLPIVGLDGSTLKYVSKESTFYVGKEEKSPTIEIPTFIQGLHRFGSHAPFPTAHVTESLLNANPVELKTKQKHKILISRNENSDSYEDGPFLKDYTANFKSKLSRTMTLSLTDENKKIYSKFPNDLALKSDILHENDIITIFPESKWMDETNVPELDSKETLGESRSFQDEITDCIIRKTPMISKSQFYRRYLTYNSPYDLKKPTVSLRPKHNQDKAFLAENYYSQDPTASSVTFSHGSELYFVDEDSETTKHRPSTSSAMKTGHIVDGAPALSPQNHYEVGDSMQPGENNVRSTEFPFLLTTENVILIPEILTENNSLTDSSKSVSGVSETVTEYLDLIHGSDILENQDILIQTDFQPHSLRSIISPIDSITFANNSTGDEADPISTMERDTVNSKVKTDAQPLSTIVVEK